MYQIEAARGLVFNPYLALDNQISATSQDLAGIFGDIDSALDKGKRVRDAVEGDRVGRAMRNRLSGARLLGFQHAAKYSKAHMPALYGDKLARASRKRAGKINEWMNQTTRRTLKSTPDSDYVLSADRALSAARFENARAYFRGVADAFKGSDFQKKWNANEDACPTCLLNEDEGRIDVSAEYDSGDRFPPGHLSCGCWIVITH